MSNYYLYLCSIVFLIQCGCHKKVSPEKKLTQDLRKISEIYQAYSSSDENYKRLRDSLSRTFDHLPNSIDYDYANELNYIQKSDGIDINKNIFESDSITKLKYFQNLHPLNRFYTYYYLAKGNVTTLNPDQAFDYCFLALNQLDSLSNEYDYERNLIKKLILSSSTMYIDLGKRKVDALVTEFEKDTNANFSIQQKLKEGLEISGLLLSMKDFPGAIRWADTCLQLIPDPKSNHYYPELVFSIAYSEKELGNHKRIVDLYEENKKLYNENKIDFHTWKRFQTYFARLYIHVYPDSMVLSIIDNLLDYWGTSCDNKYYISLILTPKSKVYMMQKNVQKEMETLITTLHVLTECGVTNAYYTREEEATLQRLFILNLEMGNISKSQYYFDRLKETNKRIDNNVSNFVKMGNYFESNQLAYIDNLQELEVEKENHALQIRTIYILIIIILLISIIGIYYLLMQNTEAQKKLSLKNEKQNQNNKIIDTQNQELTKLIETLEFNNNKLQEFANKAAEAIQSPIQKIFQDIEEISVKCQSTFESEDAEMIGYLKNSTLELMEMIQVLLQYSHSNEEIVSDETVNITLVLNSIQKKLMQEIIKRDAILSYPEDMPLVIANRSLVSQLFQNLIANALKFGFPNRKIHIEVSCTVISDNAVRFAVTDNGIGIQKENLKEIFKVFKKIETTEDYEGSGIGLSTCQKIVENFGGKLWVESEWGRGSIFYFTLPIQKYVNHNQTSELYEIA